MIPKSCKRLAEVDFPIAVVSRHSAREKSIRHGHPSTLHLWWARRPLALMASEKRTEKVRRDCYLLYGVTRCKRREGLRLMQITKPAQMELDVIRKIDHYARSFHALSSCVRSSVVTFQGTGVSD
jgi:Protein of unknown function (DUF1156)